MEHDQNSDLSNKANRSYPEHRPLKRPFIKQHTNQHITEANGNVRGKVQEAKIKAAEVVRLLS